MIMRSVATAAVFPFYFNYTSEQGNYIVIKINKPLLQGYRVKTCRLLNDIAFEDACFLISF